MQHTTVCAHCTKCLVKTYRRGAYLLPVGSVGFQGQAYCTATCFEAGAPARQAKANTKSRNPFATV